jgi:cobaltochelatase CobS
MLVKHSDRTVRKPCRLCLSMELYWAHDTDRPTGKRCDKGHQDGAFVLMNRDGSRHQCRRVKVDVDDPFDPPGDYHANMAPRSRVARSLRVCDCGRGGALGQHDEGCSVGIKEAQPEEAQPEPAQPVGVLPDDAAKALRDLLGVNVSQESVDAMVAKAIEKHSVPVVVHVKQGDLEPKPVDGATHASMPKVLQALSVGEHVMMVGPAGTGKSTIAAQCAEALDLEYGSISLSPQTPATALLGYRDANGNYQRVIFRDRYEYGGVMHLDEIDNGHPSILATTNAALANGHMAFPDGMVARHPRFLCVASANTFGRGPDRQYVGRSPIDAATLDRFTVETVGYDNALEDTLAMATGYKDWHKVVAVVRRLREQAEKERMLVVISPRASVALCRLLNAGRSWEECIDVRLRRGLSDADWGKLTQGVSVKL